MEVFLGFFRDRMKIRINADYRFRTKKESQSSLMREEIGKQLIFIKISKTTHSFLQ